MNGSVSKEERDWGLALLLHLHFAVVSSCLHLHFSFTVCVVVFVYLPCSVHCSSVNGTAGLASFWIVISVDSTTFATGSGDFGKLGKGEHRARSARGHRSPVTSRIYARAVLYHSR